MLNVTEQGPSSPKMSCCACDWDDARESDRAAGEPVLGQQLQFVLAGKSIQHPVKEAMRATNADAFAADLHVSLRL